MKLFTVLQRAESGAVPETRLISDGFNWIATLFTLPWLIWHRMWWELLIYIGLLLVLVGGVSWLGASGSALTILSYLLAVFFGLVGNDWLVAALRRKGWRERGHVLAADVDHAALRYMAEKGDAAADRRVTPGLVVLVDYGSGNLRSAAKALEHAAEAADGAFTVKVSADPADIATAERIVLPGVGAFGDCRAGLDAIPGMVDALQQAVTRDKKPFLGICVGMQLMADEGHEHGTHPGLGWIAGAVEPITPSDPALKIPHMGWNVLQLSKGGRTHPVLSGLGTDPHAYFVHSYALQAQDPGDVLATVEYGGGVTAAVGRDNRVGLQFHPENSQELGQKVLRNFLEWQP